VIVNPRFVVVYYFVGLRGCEVTAVFLRLCSGVISKPFFLETMFGKGEDCLLEVITRALQIECRASALRSFPIL
jgi:hypothetical protein